MALFIGTFSNAQSITLGPAFANALPYQENCKNHVIERDIYALSNNDSTKFADWVAYRMDSTFAKGPERSRNWKPDPALKEEETLEPSGPDDYAGAYAQYKYDRGHMAPLGSFDGTPGWEEVNYLSNITPQKAALNRGPWKQLESVERTLIQTCLAAYVICGTLYESSMPSLPSADEPHVVPSSFWKVVVCQTSKDTLVASFIFPQEVQQSASYLDFSTTLQEVEQRSGYDLFRGVNETWENHFSGFINDEWIRAAAGY